MEKQNIQETEKPKNDLFDKNIDYTKRVNQEVPAPIWKYISANELFGKKGEIKVEKLKEHLKGEGRVSPKHFKMICKQCQNILAKEKNTLELDDPITVVGDIHGQFYDLLKLLSIGGNPTTNKGIKYLFLGDYVDRGFFGCEVVLLLFSYKILFPKRIFMLRGNHECRHMTEYFNFRKECLYKYDVSVYDEIMRTFDCLPLACVLNGRFFCVHGGISPELKSIAQIDSCDRFREPPSSGFFCDLLWSDPMDDKEESESGHRLFVPNKLRGCSYVFSFKAVSAFLKNNNLLSVIRAHEAQDEGYRLYRKSNTTGFPTVICIFSCANYCDVYNNKGAIIRFKNNLMNIRQYNASPHPYYLPNFMSAFNWSMPFVIEKVFDSFKSILSLCVDNENDQSNENETASIGDIKFSLQKKKSILKKIEAVARVGRVYSILRKEKENIFQLKGLYGGALPTGLLLKGPNAIKTALEDQKIEKQAITEKRPALKREYHGNQKYIPALNIDESAFVNNSVIYNQTNENTPRINVKSGLKKRIMKKMSN